MTVNKFPLWKNLLIIFCTIIGLIYALPNIFGEDYAVQIGLPQNVKSNQYEITQATNEIKHLLQQNNISYKRVHAISSQLLSIKLRDSNSQLKTKEILTANLPTNYAVSLNLVPATPQWLQYMRAEPMKLGLDLSGGLYFLMQVDVDTVIKRQLENYVSNIRKNLRSQRIRYTGLKINEKQHSILLKFKNEKTTQSAVDYLRTHLGNLIYTQLPNIANKIQITISDAELKEVRDYAMSQSITTLRNRVNELGVAEAVVQRQGLSRISVELPGMQDITLAKNIIGNTATVVFKMAGNSYSEATKPAVPEPGYNILPLADSNEFVAVKNEDVITGDSIINANADVDSRTGKPMVTIRLGGNSAAISHFTNVTAQNIGNRMATVYMETKFHNKLISGKVVRTKQIVKKIISVATIQSVLGNNFEISNLSNMQEASKLALLLRAGALPAPIDIIAERTIGPSLGKDNIHKGVDSLVFGLSLIIVFMVIYYRIFGFIADIALFLNLILLVAICSIIHVTMTLPGIAGIVLTLGMAVDANVLIFERIREEIRAGSSIQDSIHAGYDKAFVTIVDANVTTLIAAIVLFTLGSGPIKGFAVTLTIGLLTSMFTAVTCSRAIVNYLFGNKKLQTLYI